jgi:hypothetical protein
LRLYSRRVAPPGKTLRRNFSFFSFPFSFTLSFFSAMSSHAQRGDVAVVFPQGHPSGEDPTEKFFIPTIPLCGMSGSPLKLRFFTFHFSFFIHSRLAKDLTSGSALRHSPFTIHYSLYFTAGACKTCVSVASVATE